ncbi:hypothetical protein EG327_008390 [Venturia inaequalis]|uniref:Uncharacterized protein n=1 Tax=Venturia inaequalis TaxID=5025 RepID=A0A8H3UUR3_VENIN|nr:hypothetical protein EG327_008390 [Venturia inaequalis]
MKLTSALLLACGIISTVSGKMTTHFAGCSRKSIGAYNHCAEHNGGVSPCDSDSSCFVACGQAGSQDKSGDFRMVADYNGPTSAAQCECRCFRKRERFPW